MENVEKSKNYIESDAKGNNRTRRPILNKKVECQIGRFAKRLSEAIGDESVRSFALRAGISEGAIRQYIKGYRFPDLDFLAALADTANVNLLWLATGEGPMRGASTESVTLCAGHVDVDTLTRALMLVEVMGAGLPVERMARVVAGIYDLFTKEGRTLDADAIRQVAELLI